MECEQRFKHAYGCTQGAVRAPGSKGVTVSDKSPKKSSSKTAASKTLKEKRADKKAKVESRAGNDVSEATHRKR